MAIIRAISATTAILNWSPRSVSLLITVDKRIKAGSKNAIAPPAPSELFLNAFLVDRVLFLKLLICSK